MTVGFIGGSYMFDLGDAASMDRLSILVKGIAAGNVREQLLRDQIFRTYVKLDDVEDAVSLMRCVRNELRRRTAGAAGAHTGGADEKDGFEAYFNAFEECATSCRDFHRNWGILKPVRVARIDMPAYLQDTARSLDVLDSLAADDDPFWKKGFG